jgi:hypothetical protein
VDGSLLVADEDELHVRLDRLEGVEDRDRGAAGVAEDVLDAEVGEGFDERLCAVHFPAFEDVAGENLELARRDERLHPAKGDVHDLVLPFLFPELFERDAVRIGAAVDGRGAAFFRFFARVEVRLAVLLLLAAAELVEDAPAGLVEEEGLEGARGWCRTSSFAGSSPRR